MPSYSMQDFLAAIAQSFDSTIIIVRDTLPLADFLMKFATCSLWFGFLHRFKSIAKIMSEVIQKHCNTKRAKRERGCVQDVIVVPALVRPIKTLMKCTKGS